MRSHDDADRITDRARAEAEQRWPRFPVGSPWRTVARDVRYGFRLGAEWAASLPPTDEEVRAAAWAICRLEDEGYEPTEDHPCKACTEAARAALTAARETQR